MFGPIIIAGSDRLYELGNQVAGHFWLLDNLIALTLHNNLVKAALLGGCFMAAWFARRHQSDAVRVRGVLIVTLIASGFVVATTRVVSSHMLHPRPFVYSQETYHLDGDRLVESKHLPYRVPLDSASQKKYRQVSGGELAANDLDAFPSDHAALYTAITAGIVLASPVIGRFALAWTILVVLAGRIITGQHSPLDIMAGVVIGLSIFTACQTVLGTWLRRIVDALAQWTFRHEALATAIMFVALFEISNTLQDLSSLIDAGSAIARYFQVG